MTGAASGIGRAIAIALAREGVNLVLSDHDADGLASAQSDAAKLGVSATTAICDLTQPAEIAEMLDRLFSTGPLHILVNCAGIALYGQQRSVSDSDWRNLMAVNLLAPMQITTHLINVLARSDEAHIVNMSSIFGLVPVRGLAAYQASKYGLVGFTLAMRNDYHRKNFGVSVICPGLVKTPMIEPDGPSKIYAKMPRLPAWLFTTPGARRRSDRERHQARQGVGRRHLRRACDVVPQPLLSRARRPPQPRGMAVARRHHPAG